MQDYSRRVDLSDALKNTYSQILSDVCGQNTSPYDYILADTSCSARYIYRIINGMLSVFYTLSRKLLSYWSQGA